MSCRNTGILLALGLGASGAVQAEWRCDCTTILDSCTAQVAIASEWVEVTTDHQQCARVDYFIDGIPFVTLVVEGSQRQDWINRSQSPNVLVQSCQVCLDNSDAEPPASTAPAPSGSSVLEPLIEVPPIFPATAQARGVEGYVDLSFTVDAFGVVTDAAVTASEPNGVFDQAALAAVNRWRFSADPERAPQTLTRRLDFELSDYIFQLTTRAEPEPAAQVSMVRNQCVREQAVYNYGEMIEVGLMNACDDPLIVFGCAEGTGPNADLWVCVDSERQQSLLAAQTDSRIGNLALIATPGGQRSYEFTSSFFVSRAPNSQYWWLACSPEDTVCRDSARLWARSLDRQLASVDPQSRTSLPISRSF